MNLARRTVAEFLGTAFLLSAVVGSGIMGERLSGGNVAIALLANTIATAATLAALILTFGPISGAHFNPAVTLADALDRATGWSVTAAYVCAQMLGALAGVAAVQSYVRRTAFLRVPTRPGRRSTVVQRVRRHVRPDLGHLGLCSTQAGSCAVRRRSLHRGCILVHRVHLVCQSRRHAGALLNKHICGHSAGGRSGVYCRADARRRGGNGSVPLANT